MYLFPLGGVDGTEDVSTPVIVEVSVRERCFQCQRVSSGRGTRRVRNNVHMTRSL